MRRSMLLLTLVSASIFAQTQIAKPKLTLDEFFNSVSFTAVKVSPDGNSVVIATDGPLGAADLPQGTLALSGRSREPDPVDAIRA